MKYHFSRLSEQYIPLSAIIPEPAKDEPAEKWETALTQMLTQLLMMPVSTGPTAGYNNLYIRLLEKGLGSDKVQDKPSLDSDKINAPCRPCTEK